MHLYRNIYIIYKFLDQLCFNLKKYFEIFLQNVNELNGEFGKEIKPDEDD